MENKNEHDIEVSNNQNESQTETQTTVQNTNVMSYEEFSKTIWDKHTVGIFDSRGNRDEFKKIVNIKTKDNVDGSNIYAKGGSAAKYWLNYFDGNTEWLNDIDKIFIALGVNAPWDYENMEKLLDKILAEKESSAKVMILENYPTTFPNSSRENAEKNQKQFDEYHEKLKQYANVHPDVFFIKTLQYPNNLLLENGQMENCSDGLHVDAWTDAGKETLRKFVDNINHATYDAYKEAGLLNKQVSFDTQGENKKAGIKVAVSSTPDEYGEKNIANATPKEIANMGWEAFEKGLDKMKVQQDLKVRAILSNNVSGNQVSMDTQEESKESDPIVAINVTPENEIQMISDSSDGYPIFEHIRKLCRSTTNSQQDGEYIIKKHSIANKDYIWFCHNLPDGGQNIAITPAEKYANGMFKAYTQECYKLSYLLDQKKEERDSQVRAVLSQLNRNTDGDRG